MIEQSVPDILALSLATVAAYTGGQVIDARAASTAEEAKQPVMEEWGIAPVDEVKHEEQASRTFKQKARRLLSVATRPLPMAAAATGLLVAASVLSIESVSTAPPFVGEAVDHSAATNFDIDGPVTLPTINRVASEFKKTDSLQSEAFVGAFGDVTAMNVDEVNSTVAAGGAPMDKATKEALNQANFVKPQGKGKDTAVLVITNGNTVGNAGTVIQEAQSGGKTTPVYIENVEPTQYTSQANISAYQQITSLTGGHYWSANSANSQQIKSTVEYSLTPVSNENNGFNPDDGIFIAGAVIAAVTTTRLIASRRKGYMQRNLQGKRR